MQFIQASYQEIDKIIELAQKIEQFKDGKIDIKKLVSETGSERLEDAVPIVCNPGDVVICNRQILHGSFPNCGFEPRVTVNFGFHKRFLR